jgi:hypothetical protein
MVKTLRERASEDVARVSCQWLGPEQGLPPIGIQSSNNIIFSHYLIFCSIIISDCPRSHMLSLLPPLPPSYFPVPLHLIYILVSSSPSPPLRPLLPLVSRLSHISPTFLLFLFSCPAHSLWPRTRWGSVPVRSCGSHRHPTACSFLVLILTNIHPTGMTR